MSEYSGFTLHQIAPYIGKLRPSLARQLVRRYSSQGDVVWDPFCGSGTIPLEAKLLHRNVIASDVNPYACVLTRAKLHAPCSAEKALNQLTRAVDELSAMQLEKKDVPPSWVSKFFHDRTLAEVRVLMRWFLRNRDYFNAGCLLGILHHQRPGFLSYPSSHLVPYLRTRLFPKDVYPEAYRYREPISRLRAKIERTLDDPPPPTISRYKVLQKSALKEYVRDTLVDSVITSPPYMDALDYCRDNRLRLWFLGVPDYKAVRETEMRKIGRFRADMYKSLQIIARVLKPGGACVMVLGDVTRTRKRYDVPQMICEIVSSGLKDLQLESRRTEELPDIRRSRKSGRATREETILVFRCRRKY